MQNNKTILALDTTSSPLLVAVQNGGVSAGVKRAGIKQEELLFPSIKKALDKKGAKFNKIDKVFYVRGPGRFTGIRIGLTVATMLRSLTGSEAVSATMFEVIYHKVQKSKEFKNWLKQNLSGKAAVVLHAFREEYFLQIFDGSAPQWFAKDDMLSFMAQYKEPLFVAGFDKERTSLKDFFAGLKYTLASDKLSKVDARTLIEIAQAKSFEADTLEPLYLKPARFELGK
ncbi:tRNA threonylcarbamoyl adenosine modification protein YeaZ [Elusimicrobium posterum]|uniref:tRNA (adenosine(37)-N6)-threonylcarbamoyltransferase complex dimerization subunit type 1 TsaB n=1 Tax=Elusimicrobium posterum TaxID=3116653 RepID=UPI003C791D01